MGPTIFNPCDGAPFHVRICAFVRKFYSSLTAATFCVCLAFMGESIPILQLKQSFGAPSDQSAVSGKNNYTKCGPSALYLLLRLSGKQVTYRTVAAQLDPERGDRVSLQALCDTARSFGLECDIRKCVMADLCRCPTPSIAHFQSDDALFERGHYMVVLSADQGHVRCIDSISARILKYTVSRFDDVWSGYILVPRRPANHFVSLMLISTAFWGLSGYVLFLR